MGDVPNGFRQPGGQHLPPPPADSVLIGFAAQRHPTAILALNHQPARPSPG